jgi:hypothetical protein
LQKKKRLEDLQKKSNKATKLVVLHLKRKRQKQKIREKMLKKLLNQNLLLKMMMTILKKRKKATQNSIWMIQLRFFKNSMQNVRKD